MDFKKIILGAAMVSVMAMPAMAGVDLTINVGADDQAHFDFNGGMGRHTPEIWKAAQQLQNAKHSLWKARNDFHGHKADAIGAINAALDQLRICEGR